MSRKFTPLDVFNILDITDIIINYSDIGSIISFFCSTKMLYKEIDYKKLFYSICSNVNINGKKFINDRFPLLKTRPKICRINYRELFYYLNTVICSGCSNCTFMDKPINYKKQQEQIFSHVRLCTNCIGSNPTYGEISKNKVKQKYGTAMLKNLTEIKSKYKISDLIKLDNNNNNNVDYQVEIIIELLNSITVNISNFDQASKSKLVDLIISFINRNFYNFHIRTVEIVINFLCIVEFCLEHNIEYHLNTYDFNQIVFDYTYMYNNTKKIFEIINCIMVSNIKLNHENTSPKIFFDNLKSIKPITPRTILKNHTNLNKNMVKIITLPSDLMDRIWDKNNTGYVHILYWDMFFLPKTTLTNIAKHYKIKSYSTMIVKKGLKCLIDSIVMVTGYETPS